MKLFGLIGAASYCLTALVIGVRLLLVARRTKELPEFLIGFAFLCGGAVGYTSLVAAGVAAAAAPAAAPVLFYAGWTGLVGACICLSLFWERVYQPGVSLSRGVAGLLITFLVVSLVGLFGDYEPGTGGPHTSPWYLPGLCAQGAVYGLNGWFSVRLHRSLRRRFKLGLADPVVVNRVLLWSISAWAVSVQYVYSITRLALTGQSSTSGSGAALISALGLVAAFCMGLAFYPPRFYRRLIERRSGAGASPASI